jgi:hypothetical protein
MAVELEREGGEGESFSVLLEFEASKMLVTVPSNAENPLSILEEKLKRFDKNLQLTTNYRYYTRQ